MPSRRILIVDDNIAAAESLGKLLELRGHVIARAHTGTDALDTAREYDPDIIILDIGLPDLDGYEVAQFLRKEESRSSLIALTGYGLDTDKERAKEAGFDFHLTKPVGLFELEEVFAQIN
jgi:CheY-like chemotaxis protein